MSSEDSRNAVSLDADLQTAIEAKARIQGNSVSTLVNDAVRAMLRDDIEDLAAFDERAGQSSVTLDDMRKMLKEDGKL